jgi:hypothetical protein
VYLFFKEKAMAKGKRGGPREGAGRKSLGRAARVATLVRLLPEVRARLERDRERLKRRSLSEHIERELADAIRAAAPADKRAKALGFLISQITRAGQVEERAGGPKEFDWRSNPADFVAFRSAVMHLLDALAPTGEPDSARYPERRSPEGAGELMADLTLNFLRTPAFDLHAIGERYGEHHGKFYYGFAQAARDLGLSGGKK